MKCIVIIHDAKNVNVHKNQSILNITMFWVKCMI